jgi:SAM-dependent methyltransferase
MSGFSPDWLALREAADHRSRDRGLAEALARHARERERVAVVDIGCGTGSNLRATSALLGAAQSWTLVDYDARLLGIAREQLAAWADEARAVGDILHLRKSGRAITVSFRQADLNQDLDSALGPAADLITASAFFDLASPEFIARFTHATAARRAAFYTVLTYNGVQRWAPPHAADEAMAKAFHAHQMTDKGLGQAAGPLAPKALAGAFRAATYDVWEGDSPWRLDHADAVLLHELVPGFAGAVAETGRVPPATIEAWLSQARDACEVGHTDTLALPQPR